MDKQKLIESITDLPSDFSRQRPMIDKLTALELIKLLDEPEVGQADEAPRYVKNILARLRELPLHDREVWLKAIMGEFGRDFSRAKWREGYEQGKLEGAWVGNQLKDADKIRQELNKPVVKQFVADWYEENKDVFEGNLYRFVYNLTSIFDGAKLNEFERWFLTAGTKPFQTLINMHQFGYEVEKEKRYLVRVKGVNDYGCYLNKGLLSKEYFLESKAEIGGCRTKHTRKQLEDDGFGWVFDCEGIEIEEVTE
jgi:gp178